VFQILNDRRQDLPPALAPEPAPVDRRELARAHPQVAELALGLLARRPIFDAGSDQVVDATLDMEADLVVDVAADRARSAAQAEEAADAGRAGGVGHAVAGSSAVMMRDTASA